MKVLPALIIGFLVFYFSSPAHASCWTATDADRCWPNDDVACSCTWVSGSYSCQSINSALTPISCPAGQFAKRIIDIRCTLQSENTLCSGGPECFLSGTKIDTPDGLRNIEDLKTGDKVLSFDKNTNNVVENIVLEPIKTIKNSYFILKSLLGKEVKVTEEHPFYVGNESIPSDSVESGFKKAKDLEVGDTIYVMESETLTQDSISSIQYVGDQKEVYNLRVKNAPFTFFAESIAVHNKTDNCPIIDINPANITDLGDHDRFDVTFYGMPGACIPDGDATVNIGWDEASMAAGPAYDCYGVPAGSASCTSTHSINNSGAQNIWGTKYEDFQNPEESVSWHPIYWQSKGEGCGAGSTVCHERCPNPQGTISTTQALPNGNITFTIYTFIPEDTSESVLGATQRLHDTTGNVWDRIVYNGGPINHGAGYLHDCTFVKEDNKLKYTCKAPQNPGTYEARFATKKNCEVLFSYNVVSPTSVSGRVVDSSTGLGISGIVIQIYNGGSIREISTSSTGYFSMDTTGFIGDGAYYDVIVKGNLDGTAPTGYVFPAHPTTTSYSYSFTDKRNTIYNDLYYKTQMYEFEDCAGPAGVGGVSGRCNFSYTPVVAETDICTDPMPACPVGGQILSNPTFNSGSSSWSFYSAPSPNNATGEWGRGALKMTSFGAARSGWSQSISTGDGYLWGDKVRIAANLYRSVNQGSNPYIGLNIKRVGSPSWEYNYGGTVALNTVNTCTQIYKDITLPNDIERIEAFVYNWDASAGYSYADWISLCELPPVTYSCTGSLPSGASLCTGDGEGLVSDTPYVEVPSCTDGRKCEYTTITTLPCSTTGTCVCTGTKPAEGVLCPGDAQGLTDNFPYREVETCSDEIMCEYTIPELTCADTGTCMCLGQLPAGATICSGDDQGLQVDTIYTQVDVCVPNNSVKCEYTAALPACTVNDSCSCNDICTVDTDCLSDPTSPSVCYGGFCRNSSCTSSVTPSPSGFCSCPAVCTGTIPSTGQVCLGDDTGLTVDTPYTEVASCTDGVKCEYTIPPSNATYVLGRFWKDDNANLVRESTEPLLTSTGVNNFADVTVDVQCGSWNGEAYYDAVNNCDSEGRGPYETGWIGKDSVNGPCTITATVNTDGWYFTSNNAIRNWHDTLLAEEGACWGNWGTSGVLYTGSCVDSNPADGVCTKVRVVINDWLDTIKNNNMGFANLWFGIDGETTTPTYRCIGTLPSGSTLCTGDDLGLSSDTLLTPVSSCTDSQKCEYTVSSGVGSAACELTVGYPDENDNCKLIRVNPAGLIFGGDTVECLD